MSRLYVQPVAFGSGASWGPGDFLIEIMAMKNHRLNTIDKK
jgi:hypothetical protein